MTDTTTGERGGAATPDIVIITGMSGAGRSTAAKTLEDLGWFVVDNLPPALLPTMLDLADPAAPGRTGRGVGDRRRAVAAVLHRPEVGDLIPRGPRGRSPRAVPRGVGPGAR